MTDKWKSTPQEELCKLSFAERLGLAWCKLNCGEWDENLLGVYPKNYPDKEFVFRNAMDGLEKIIGEAEISRCWWKYILEKSDEEWFRWYTVGRFRYGELKKWEYKSADKEKRGFSIPIFVLCAAITTGLFVLLRLLIA